MDENKQWVEVDIDKLSTVLAEDDWMIQVSAVNLDDLYENIAVLDPTNKSAKIMKEVRSKWATLFFLLKNEYTNLVMNYSKPQYDSQTKYSEDKSNRGMDTGKIEPSPDI